jgi:hypothetical protein
LADAGTKTATVHLSPSWIVAGSMEISVSLLHTRCMRGLFSASADFTSDGRSPVRNASQVCRPAQSICFFAAS